jgi:hypothetical protein
LRACLDPSGTGSRDFIVRVGWQALALCDAGNTGKTPGVAALFSCTGSGEPDSSYV